ncbi:MAG: hypothetical protein HYX20_02455 [Candidatus Yanofskybacteria bacterium]|nr:hypothetical protein [Candidatus Yanofskybacteria bacterium]
MTKPINKIIGFDLDGVILNHTPNKLNLAKSFGWKLSPEQTHSEIIRTIMPKHALDQLKLTLYDDPEVSLKSPVTRGARSTLSEIKNKYSYFLISRRKKPEIAIRILKIKKLWPEFFNENNTFFVSKPKDKNKIGKKLGITHYVDDELRVLEKLTDIKNKILFDPYNSFPYATNFIKVKSWKELFGLINS